MDNNISIRRATVDDAEIIAKVVAMAIGDKSALESYCGKDYHSVLTTIAQQQDTQYSYKFALIAQIGSATAGAMVGYDGALLHKLRKATFAVIQKNTGHLPNIADETESGEFYLDSVAVFAEFRGRGVGAALIRALCDRAATEGHSRVGLIVDNINPQAERLYTSLGFKRVGSRQFLGHQMWHLQQELYLNSTTPLSE